MLATHHRYLLRGGDDSERTIKRVLDENDYPVDLGRVFSFFKEKGDSIAG